MIAPLLIAVVLALAAIAGTLYVRTLMLDAAAEAARYGAQSQTGPAGAEARARELLESNVPAVVRGVRASATRTGGVAVVEVEVRAEVVGGITLEVRAHAPVE